MTKDKASECARVLANNFPNQVNQEQARTFMEQVSALDFDCAVAAIRAHKATRMDGFWNMAQLLEGCRAAERSADQATLNNRREGTNADVYRRQTPQMRNATDIEVILRVHRGWWHKCSRSDGYRRKFESSAKYQIYMAMMADVLGEPTDQRASEASEIAARFAETIFADPETFALSLQDVRGEIPA